MLIGLSGYARSGKDTLAGILVAEHGFRRVAFADKLRELALAASHSWFKAKVATVGWDEAKKDPETRAFLQRLGTGVRDILGADTWINAALADTHVGDRVVVTDVRFKNEAHAIHVRGGWVVRVTRPGITAVNDHISEHDLDDWPFACQISNGGAVDDLREPLAGMLELL